MPEERITSNPDIMMGKPVVGGTRITVEYLLRAVATGMTAQEIVREHPRLTADDLGAAFTFAANQMRNAWLATQPEGALVWEQDGPEWTTVERPN